MTADVLAVFIGGLVQPYARAFIARWTGYEPTTKKGQRWYTVGLSAVTMSIALAVTWALGGYADFSLPAGASAIDPSPWVYYLWPKLTALYGLSHLVFAISEKPLAAIAGPEHKPA